MESVEQQKLLLKIVIGAAWIDRHLAPEEIEYLEKLLAQYHLHLNSELQKLLKQPITPQQTENWIVEYLEDTTQEERMRLLSAIANMCMADEKVSEIEHQLLDEYYELMARIPPHPEHTPTLVETVSRFVKKMINSVRT
ncbi:MAG: TerB family tellurite resistance protein [Prochloraceae cyanobacterium]